MSEETVDFVKAKKLMTQQIQAGISNRLPTDVTRIEIRINPIDEISWISSQRSDVKIFGANQDNTACIAGVGEAVSIKIKTSTSYKKIFAQMRKYLKPKYPYLQWYGGLSFDPKRSSSEWKEFGAYRFVIPRFEIASDTSSMIFCCNIIGKLSLKQREQILKQLDALETGIQKKDIPLKAAKRADSPSIGQWDRNVQEVLKSIAKGRLQKAVLARQTKLRFAKDIDPWLVLRRLFDVTPNSYHFCFQFGESAFLGASPERLYRKYGQVIISEAIAGTAARGRGLSQDHAFKDQLLASVKDNHEHGFVVKAIDEGLKKICQDHQHTDKPRVLTLGNGHHLITTFEGKLKDKIHEEDIIAALHPTPAVGGAPQKQALEMLGDLEAFGRGWYTGLIGYVGLDWSEFVVGIRSALVKGKQMTVYAGAGIVQGSDAQSEWQEIENKISNFIKIIQ
jgi:menaquinone-specific isochorismate synthase